MKRGFLRPFEAAAGVIGLILFLWILAKIIQIEGSANSAGFVHGVLGTIVTGFTSFIGNVLHDFGL